MKTIRLSRLFPARLNLLLGLGISIASLAGCTRGLRPTAASDHDCPERVVYSERVSFRVRRVTGCGSEDYYVRVGGGGWQSLGERATYDLDCGLSALKLRHLHGHMVGATGCGRGATYAGLMGQGWILEGSAEL